jgi:uncharacterized protein YbaR (Trm112 family)
MICAHSTLACPFCRRRLSTWLRYNPDYSKLIIKRESNLPIETKRLVIRKSKRSFRTLPLNAIGIVQLFAY